MQATATARTLNLTEVDHRKIRKSSIFLKGIKGRVSTTWPLSSKTWKISIITSMKECIIMQMAESMLS